MSRVAIDLLVVCFGELCAAKLRIIFGVWQGCTHFPKTQEPPQKCRCQIGDINRSAQILGASLRDQLRFGLWFIIFVSSHYETFLMSPFWHVQF
jgi:hypothetical protein